MTILQLEQICGFLNFFGRTVYPGHAFTRRLYAQLIGHDRLKQHHHIWVMDEMLMDLKMWNMFLEHQTAYYRSFTDFNKSADIEKSVFTWTHHVISIWNSVVSVSLIQSGCKEIGLKNLKLKNQVSNISNFMCKWLVSWHGNTFC